MIDAESQLMGALILDCHYLVETNKLEPDDFQEKAFGEIFGRLRDLYNSGLQYSPYELADRFVDLPTLQPYALEELKKFFFNIARGTVVMLLDVPALVRAVRYSGLRKKLGDVLATAEFEREKKDLEPLIQNIQDELAALSLAPDEQKNSSIKKVGDEILEDMLSAPKVYPTGLPMLDDVMAGGLYGGKCYGFAARKKCGKTAFMVTVAQNLNKAGVGVVYIALEMGRKEIMHRIVSRGLNCKPINFINHRKSEKEFQKDVENFNAVNPSNLFFIDKAGISFEELKRELLLIYRKNQPKVIILDYWQLVGGKDKLSTAEHLDSVAQWLATFAKEHGVAVIAASQINQEGNTRGSEGMRLAFDQVYQIHRMDEEGDQPKLWMELMDTRYTIWQNIGDEKTARFTINPNGVYFEEIYYSAA